MKESEVFLKAYHEFRNSVDVTKGGILPDLNNLIWCILMGVPSVPADEESSEEAGAKAVDQRIAILKAVFVEANYDQSEDFVDQGLRTYDEAGRAAKRLLAEGKLLPGPEEQTILM